MILKSTAIVKQKIFTSAIIQKRMSGSCPVSQDPLVANVKIGTPYKINDVDKVGTLPLGIVPAGILYQRPQLTGQTTSYANYDDGWNLANNVYYYIRPANPLYVAELDPDSVDPYLTLKQQNAFGTLDRFTDINGLQVYGDNYLIDHLTGLGRLWDNSNLTWADYLISCNSAINLGFSDWFAESQKSIVALWNNEWDKPVDNHPFIKLGIASNRSVWSSTTDPRSSTNAVRGSTNRIYMLSESKALLKSYFLVRTHY